MPTPVHESPSRYLSTILFAEVNAWLTRVNPRVTMLTANNATYHLPNCEKVPDGGLYTFTTRRSPVFPQMILEVGYAQSYRSLVGDAQDWLMGSVEVRSVMLVKFVKPENKYLHLVNKWEVYMEIWERTQDGRCVLVQSWCVERNN